MLVSTATAVVIDKFNLVQSQEEHDIFEQKGYLANAGYPIAMRLST